MSVISSENHPELIAAQPNWSRSSILALVALILLLIFATPQLICLPVTNDVSYYDIQARTALKGGVLYRDMLEPNFPGVVWIHIGVRSLFGWSTEVLRAFDLLFFSFIVILLTRFVAVSRIQLSFVLVLTYYSVSEWCHVQRDVWLIIPAVAGVTMRYYQLQRLSHSETSTKSIFFYAILEGLVWGAGVWIKPHLVIPALAVWICSLFLLSTRRQIFQDLAGLLTGGILAGALGIGWLISSQSWSWFLEMQLEWNREYLKSGNLLWNKVMLTNLLIRLFPYWLVHLVAIPMAVITLFKKDFGSDQSNFIRLKLLATLYLAWCLQVVLLQHPYDYTFLPPIILGIAFLALWFHCTNYHIRFHRFLTYGFVCLALILSPITKPESIMLWADCLNQGSTSTIRNRLARIPFPDWRDLELVGNFLESQQAKDFEISCYNNDMVHLYRDLNLEPSTRFVYLSSYSNYYPSKRPLIEQALQKSPERFVLSNLMSAGLLVNQAKEIGPSGVNSFPPAFPPKLRSRYPWNLPIVFRSGTLVVHQMPEKKVAKKSSTEGDVPITSQESK